MINPANSRFAYVQSDLGMKRSRFDRPHTHKTTLSAGKLYPLLVDEVLPGDTYSVDTSALVRMSTPIHPVMDDCFLDIYYFFVPARITWEHWKEFMGESPSDPYVNPVEYTIPYLERRPTSDIEPQGVPAHSLLDYMGIPTGTAPRRINALPFRAFCLIWNEWFRDQNLQNAINVPLDDSNIGYALSGVSSPEDSQFYDFWNPSNPNAYVLNSCHGGDLPPVNKYHDYFTSALKEPQKGDPVPIPLSGFAPVYVSSNGLDTETLRLTLRDRGLVSPRAVSWRDEAGAIVSGNVDLSEFGTAVLNDGASVDGTIDLFYNDTVADLSLLKDTGIYSTISDLRFAFQMQKFLEADNRGGTRYREILKQHFNVISPDATQQIPEFLGGKRIPINMSQVLQTSATDDVSPQGNTAAYSLTTDKHSAFTKSFTEHGYLFAVGCIRTRHTYAQGVDPLFSRFNRFDFYFPEFANISEQPIYNRELYNPAAVAGTAGGTDFGDQIFGYKEAWAEYRFKPNRVSGEFRPTNPTPLSAWTYVDDYDSPPYLSSEWIRETRVNIDRTLAVNDPDIDQFIADFFFDMKTTRVMPVYSIPGLADHH